MKWFSDRGRIALLVAPTLLIYIVYIVAPIFIAARYSTTKFSGIGQPQPVGMENYVRLLNDPLFIIALKNTAIVLVVTLVILIPGSFGLALLLRRSVRWMSAVRAINFAPSIIAPILVGLIWVFILDPQIGLVNQLLRAIGLDSLAQMWIGGDTLTPFSLAVVQSWQSLGYIATIFIAGMTLIPAELYEAADIDGASGWAKTVNITIPLLNETFKMNVILVVTLVFKIFETVLQLTNGGPNHQSELMVTYMYYVTFTAGQYGYGMAIAVATLVITILSAGLIFAVPALKKALTKGGGDA